MRIAALFVSGLLIAGVLPAPVLSQSSDHPNPNANSNCPFGPGKARWDVKTSLISGQDPSQTTTVKIADLINAPDLQVSPQTVALAHTHVARARSMMQSAQGNAQVEPFVAQVRWAPPRAGAPSQSPSTALKLPAITPKVVRRADAISQHVNPDEAPPAFFDTVLSAQLEANRLPNPVSVGGIEFREGDMISVSGYVLSSTCEKDDGDFHIDLAASAGATTCAIVEVPNPSYVASPALRTMIAKAEATAKGLSPGDHITVYGQFFYDATHSSASKPGGGRGKGYCARSLWEVHPIVRIDVH